jgi:RND superfamily putative drug exporter
MARFSIGHRRVVVALWIILALLGVFCAGRSSSRLSVTFDLPGQPAFAANTAIVSQFHSGGDNAPLVAVVTLPVGTTVDSPGVRTELASVFDRGAVALPGSRTASWVSTGSRDFVSADGRTTFALYYPPPDLRSDDPYTVALPRLERALTGQRVAGAPINVTGATILSTGGKGGSRSVLAETLFAGIAALAVLALVFGSLLALLPLVIAGIAIPTTFAGVYLLTYVTTMSTLVQNIVALVGLGIAIDYSLLIVTRWREERSNGRPVRDAVLTSARMAGHSVLFSGVTVAVSLAALALTTVPFLRSIGLAGLLIALISVAVSTTLLPVILDSLGTRLEWPRKKPTTSVSRLWTRIATGVVRHRVLAAVGSLVVLGIMIVPVFSINLGEPVATATAASAPAEARAGVEALTSSGIGAGVLLPTEILAPASATVAATSVPGGIHVVEPAAWTAGGSRVIEAWAPPDASTKAGKSALKEIRTVAATIPSSRVGGSPAQDADFIDALYGRNLVLTVAAIVVASVLLLTRALRSLWLPIKALLLNLLSLAAAFGVVTFIWQDGHGTHTLFATPASGAITLWVPLAMFALLFGLSMDYEVFILTRINEEHEAGFDTDQAVIRGIGHTGRLVSSGALILFFAFVALGGVPVTDVKILSTGLAVGILLDATIVRGVLAPSLVALFGEYNWWLPSWVARVLRVRPLTRGVVESTSASPDHASPVGSTA